MGVRVHYTGEKRLAPEPLRRLAQRRSHPRNRPIASDLELESSLEATFRPQQLGLDDLMTRVGALCGRS